MTRGQSRRSRIRAVGVPFARRMRARGRCLVGRAAAGCEAVQATALVHLGAVPVACEEGSFHVCPFHGEYASRARVVGRFPRGAVTTGLEARTEEAADGLSGARSEARRHRWMLDGRLRIHRDWDAARVRGDRRGGRGGSVGAAVIGSGPRRLASRAARDQHRQDAANERRGHTRHITSRRATRRCFRARATHPRGRRRRIRARPRGRSAASART